MIPHGNNRRMLYNFYGGKLKKLANYLKGNDGRTFFTSDFSTMAPYPKDDYITPTSTRSRGLRRTRTRSPRTISVSRGRRMSTSSAVSTRSRSTARTSASSILGTSATNVVSSALRKRGKSVKKEGRKKKVRISPKFKKMVNQVLSQKGPIGLMMETVPGGVFHLIDNLQQIQFASERSFQGVVGWKFSPTYINYVYDKIYCRGTFPINSTVNVDRYTSSFNDNQQIHVLEQYYVVKMKNNTARTLEIKLWDISPKSNQDGTVFQDIIQTLNAGTTDSANIGAVGKGTQGRENPNACTPYTIGWKPTLMSSFNKSYSLDETIIKLEPGKEYYHKVKGPNDKLYNFNHFKKNGVPIDVMSFCKTTLITATVDLTGLSLQGGNKIGRYTDMSFSGPFGLLHETAHFTKIKCPDQTGFQRLDALPAAGTVQELSQKGYAYVIQNWYDSQEGKGTVVDMEDENPQQQAINGI